MGARLEIFLVDLFYGANVHTTDRKKNFSEDRNEKNKRAGEGGRGDKTMNDGEAIV